MTRKNRLGITLSLIGAMVVSLGAVAQHPRSASANGFNGNGTPAKGSALVRILDIVEQGKKVKYEDFSTLTRRQGYSKAPHLYLDNASYIPKGPHLVGSPAMFYSFSNGGVYYVEGIIIDVLKDDKYLFRAQGKKETVLVESKDLELRRAHKFSSEVFDRRFPWDEYHTVSAGSYGDLTNIGRGKAPQAFHFHLPSHDVVIIGKGDLDIDSSTHWVNIKGIDGKDYMLPHRMLSRFTTTWPVKGLEVKVETSPQH